MKAIICGKRIAYGKSRFSVSLSSNWQVLMNGFPIGHYGDPKYFWQDIPEDKVPEEVKKLK